MNEEFEKWWEGLYAAADMKAPSPLSSEAMAARAAWQASRKQAVEECAKVCDVLAWEAAENMKLEDDERFGIYAKKYRKAATAIRAMQKD